jgi:pimeloyl-ACP methyl ester carboxylesterase
MHKVVFAHGMESSPAGTKAAYLRKRFQARTPDLGSLGLEAQVRAVSALIGEERAVLVGSSLGALTALGVAQERRARIAHLVLLAPAVGRFDASRFAEAEKKRPGLYRELCAFAELSIPEEIPATIMHGLEDELIDPDAVVALAARSPSARLLLVHDDHSLTGSEALILSVVERAARGLDPFVL